MTAVIESPAPPGRHRDADADAAFLDRLHALEVTAVRLATERDAALAQARRDAAEAAAQYRVNLKLQGYLDSDNVARRAYEARIAFLEAENSRLAALAATAKAVPTRGRWRR